MEKKTHVFCLIITILSGLKKSIGEGKPLNSTNDRVDVHDYHVLQCGENEYKN